MPKSAYGEKHRYNEDERPMAEPGRVCSDPDCEAVLSIYNVSGRCSLHPIHKVPIWRARKKGGKKRA